MSTRPQDLDPLFAPVTALSGVGPRTGKLITHLAGPHVVDLLWHLPTGLIDRRYAPNIAEAEPGRIATITLSVDRHDPPPPGRPRVPYRIQCHDKSGFLGLVFFQAKPDYLTRVLPTGTERVVSGRIETFQDRPQMTHPDYICTVSERATIQGIEASYPLTAGLGLKGIGKAIHAALARVPALPEWLDPALKAQRGWPDWSAAIRRAHAPETEADIAPMGLARARLAYDELLASQLTITLVRAQMRPRPGLAMHSDRRLRLRVLDALPFELTASQRQALAEIDADLAADRRMLRLLQGDVGSGKTVVALLAMLSAVEAGAQAVIMAQTEVLARQHFATITPLAEQADVKVALLTGRDKSKSRQKALADLADGRIDIAVGTHALFQSDVRFANLRVAVIDEQHRFGVHQRLLLARKGAAVDVLVMTATPIPRTLMLAAYGDLESSQLTEKPAGRQPIDTRAVPRDRLDDVTAAVGRAMAKRAKVYWVCPLVEESAAIDLAAATERYTALRQSFGDRVGLIHGRLSGGAKDSVMRDFATGDVDLLVATTVIEVGIDVPEASVIVIEHAERFGLAQLHQLRGRVGRGRQHGTCILLYAPPLSETARARLRILRETDDGFRIAEEDLRLRGTGEVLGTRQSGLPAFRLADLSAHADLLEIARDDARLVVERDPTLESERGQALRVLLYLFERDAVVKYSRAG